jgi:hypothetical protein
MTHQLALPARGANCIYCKHGLQTLQSTPIGSGHLRTALPQHLFCLCCACSGLPRFITILAKLPQPVCHPSWPPPVLGCRLPCSRPCVGWPLVAGNWCASTPLRDPYKKWSLLLVSARCVTSGQAPLIPITSGHSSGLPDIEGIHHLRPPLRPLLPGSVRSPSAHYPGTKLPIRTPR